MKKIFSFLLFFSFCIISIAQTAVTNAGTLYISTSSDILHISGDFTNNSGAALTNNGDLYVKQNLSGTHTFTSGLITTSATPNYLIYETGSSYSGNGDTKHVNGWVKKSGNTNFTFPVGDNTYERNIALNISASSEFNVKYSTPTL